MLFIKNLRQILSNEKLVNKYINPFQIIKIVE